MQNLRTILLASNFSQWEAVTNVAGGGRDDLMDLWNNQMGRLDGASGPDFVA